MPSSSSTWQTHKISQHRSPLGPRHTPQAFALCQEASCWEAIDERLAIILCSLFSVCGLPDDCRWLNRQLDSHVPLRDDIEMMLLVAGQAWHILIPRDFHLNSGHAMYYARPYIIDMPPRLLAHATAPRGSRSLCMPSSFCMCLSVIMIRSGLLILARPRRLLYCHVMIPSPGKQQPP